MGQRLGGRRAAGATVGGAAPVFPPAVEVVWHLALRADDNLITGLDRKATVGADLTYVFVVSHLCAGGAATGGPSGLFDSKVQVNQVWRRCGAGLSGWSDRPWQAGAGLRRVGPCRAWGAGLPTGPAHRQAEYLLATSRAEAPLYPDIFLAKRAAHSCK